MTLGNRHGNCGFLGMGGTPYLRYSEVTWDPDSLTGNPSIEVTAPGTYNFMYESACGQRDTLNIVFNAPPDDLSYNDTVLCEGDAISFDALSGHLNVNYDWSFTPLNLQEVSIDSVYEDVLVEVTVSNDCGSEIESMNININRISASAPPLGCDLTSDLLATNDFADGVWTYEAPSNRFGLILSKRCGCEPVVDVDEYGVYHLSIPMKCVVQKIRWRSILNPTAGAEILDTAICKDYLEFDAGSFQV